MKTKFASPTERDFRFVRNSTFRSEEFAQEMKIANSMADAMIVISVLFGLLAVLAFAA